MQPIGNVTVNLPH